MEKLDKLPFEGQNRLSQQEVKEILIRLNDKRLSADDKEFFVIDLGDKKRYVPKRTHIPVVTDSGHVEQVKIEKYLEDFLIKQ